MAGTWHGLFNILEPFGIQELLSFDKHLDFLQNCINGRVSCWRWKVRPWTVPVVKSDQ